MPVITHDVTIGGLRRDAVYAWLGEPGNHLHLLEGAFRHVQPRGVGVFEIEIGIPMAGGRLTYEIAGQDGSHGGRRVHVRLTGPRITGRLHWSLRTAKPSTDTLVTLHVDYEPTGSLWRVADALLMRRRLEEAWQRMADGLAAALQAHPPE
ncbi:MAG: SRPBCC family protein [Deltaproteobacteria bacterium]|nr:SRPBCC family protein [Deltaproteobacteria bacterium]